MVPPFIVNDSLCRGESARTGTDVGHAARDEVVVRPGRSARLAHHLLEGPRADHPLVQCQPAGAERVVEALARSSAVAVERNGEAIDPKLGHTTRIVVRTNEGRQGYTLR